MTLMLVTHATRFVCMCSFHISYAVLFLYMHSVLSLIQREMKMCLVFDIEVNLWCCTLKYVCSVIHKMSFYLGDN